MERDERAALLAQEVISLAQSTLLVHLRFLDRALAGVTPVKDDTLWFATDGVHIFYEPWYVLGKYKWEQTIITRDLLHAIYHCVFRHSFVGHEVDRLRWDLACDIAVEASISSMEKAFLAANRTEKQTAVLSLLNEELTGTLTAERVYHWLDVRGLSEDELSSMREPFFADQHDLWYGDCAASKEADRNLDLKKIWEDISRRMQVEMETMAKDDASVLVQSLRQINRKKQNYTEFLRHFGVYDEVMHVSEEEFDYAYYTYGLSYFGNLPLIEPLEYREEKRLREFVIAIDTSGSVKGDIVQSFVQHTYHILSRQENLSNKVDIHIIQCDDQIQEDAQIRSAEEFEQYLERMEIKGLGKTDFRPVFQYISALQKKGELRYLQGLLYFTDGRGTFPCEKPPYETAFILHDDGWDPPQIPSWAMHLTLTEDEILEQRFGSI